MSRQPKYLKKRSQYSNTQSIFSDDDPLKDVELQMSHLMYKDTKQNDVNTGISLQKLQTPHFLKQEIQTQQEQIEEGEYQDQIQFQEQTPIVYQQDLPTVVSSIHYIAITTDDGKTQLARMLDNPQSTDIPIPKITKIEPVSVQPQYSQISRLKQTIPRYNRYFKYHPKQHQQQQQQKIQVSYDSDNVLPKVSKFYPVIRKNSYQSQLPIRKYPKKINTFGRFTFAQRQKYRQKRQHQIQIQQQDTQEEQPRQQVYHKKNFSDQVLEASDLDDKLTSYMSQRTDKNFMSV